MMGDDSIDDDAGSARVTIGCLPVAVRVALAAVGLGLMVGFGIGTWAAWR